MLTLFKRLTSLSILLLTITISANVSAMTNMNGQPASIQSFAGKGKWLIVQAWSSSCPICNQTMPELVKSAHSFPNAKLIGVSLDNNNAKTQRFIKKHNINFPTLLSNNNEFDAYLKRVAKERLTGTPTFLIFSPDGKLAAMQPGSVPPQTLKNFLRNQR